MDDITPFLVVAASLTGTVFLSVLGWVLTRIVALIEASKVLAVQIEHLKADDDAIRKRLDVLGA